jgi:hypothetical protein
MPHGGGAGRNGRVALGTRGLHRDPHLGRLHGPCHSTVATGPSATYLVRSGVQLLLTAGQLCRQRQARILGLQEIRDGLVGSKTARAR